MAMALYDILGSLVPTNLSIVDPTVYSMGTRFRITSSIAGVVFQPYTASVSGIKIYRGNLYTGPYTGSLWRVSDQTMMGTTCSIPPRGVPYGWESASFNPPISISLDTDYIITRYSYANSYCDTLNIFATNYYSNSLWNPVVGLHTAYTATGSLANPAPPSYPNPTVVDPNWHGTDVIVSASLITYPMGNTRGMATQCVNGFLQGISLGSPTSIAGDTPMGRHLQVGVTQSLGEGFPAPPSLQLNVPGFWRFRWSVKAGPRAIYVSAKQNSTGSVYRPSVILKQNNAVGLTADVSASAAAGADWQQIPMAFTATGNGVVWVELWNNNTAMFNAPAFFDHIITT